MHNVDMGTVIYNTLFGFSFSGILLLLILLGVGALWCTVPFAVFGVKKRLDGIDAAQRSQTEMLTAELKRINETFRQRISQGPAVAEAAVQPVRIDQDIQAAMDVAEQQLAGRAPMPQPMPVRLPAAGQPMAPQPMPTQIAPQQMPAQQMPAQQHPVQQYPAQPAAAPRPMPMPARRFPVAVAAPAPAPAAPVSAMASMFGNRPSNLNASMMQTGRRA